MRQLALLLMLPYFMVSCLETNEQDHKWHFFPKSIQASHSRKAIFWQADSLRFSQNYLTAARSYENLLSSEDLSIAESLYVNNQITYCYLTQDKDQEAASWLNKSRELLAKTPEHTKEGLADYYYNKSRFHYLRFELDSAFSYSHRCRFLYNTTDAGSVLKNMQSMTLLALIYIEDEQHNDSILHYANMASDSLLKYQELGPYSAELNFTMAYVSFLFRAHERAENYAKNALRRLAAIPHPSKLLKARSLNIQGNMLKKQADALQLSQDLNLQANIDSLYALADSMCFNKAIKIGHEINNVRVQEFYRDRIILLSRYQDSSAFYKNLAKLKKVKTTQKDRFGYIDRLMGYFYHTKNRNLDSANYYYTKFLKQQGSRKRIEYKLLDETFYTLRKIHLSNDDFNYALKYSLESSELFGCREKSSPGSQTDDLDSTRTRCLVNYYFHAKILFDQYNYARSKKVEDLLTINQYFDWISTHFFSSIVNADEDALLTFQSEIGIGIFRTALEVGIKTWEETQDKIWLDRIFRYMEQLKSYLLYRNLLKPLSPIKEAFIYADNIQLYQDKIAQFTHIPSNKADPVDFDSLFKTQYLLSKHISFYSKKFKEELGHKSLNIEQVQRQLNKDQVLIEYNKLHKGWLALSIAKDTVQLFILPDSINLPKLLTDYKACLEQVRHTKKDKENYVHLARKLYKLLLGPLTETLTEKEQLIVVPDQDLHAVPFEAFLHKETNSDPIKFQTLPYVLKYLDVIYSSSWRVFQLNQERIKKNPIDSIGVWIAEEFKDEKESVLNSISKYAIDAKSFNIFNKDGKEFFIKKHKKYDLIHLTLHAKDSEHDRQGNLIYFGNKIEEHMYGFELSQYKFNAQLLVLSACSSNKGTVLPGEGSFNLTRSFMQAGIPQIVSTLWEVKQASTDEIISRLYMYLDQGLSPSKALRRAKLSYLEQRKSSIPGFAFPGNWAGIVMSK